MKKQSTASAVAKIEGKKVPVSIGNIREVEKAYILLEADAMLAEARSLEELQGMGFAQAGPLAELSDRAQLEALRRFKTTKTTRKPRATKKKTGKKK